MQKELIVITRGNIGGAQISVLSLARKLKEKGIIVSVAFGEGKFLEKELAKSDIKTVRLKELKRTQNPIQNLKYILELKKHLKDNKFHSIHFNSTNALFGGIAAKLTCRDIKTIFTFRGMSVLDVRHEASKIVKAFYFYLFKFLLLFIDEAVYVSEMNYDFGQKIGLTKSGKTIYNGVDPDSLNFLEKNSGREKLSKIIDFDVQDKYIIGSIGRLFFPKNYEFLIGIFPEILKIRSDAILVIIGEGIEREKYEKLIKKLDLEKHVFLAGEIDNASKFIQCFDLFTLVSKYEGLSITLIEAMFSRIPVIASMVGGNTEMFEHEAVQLFEVDNKDKYLENFKRISGEKELVEKIKESNGKRAQDFHINKTADNYIKLVG